MNDVKLGNIQIDGLRALEDELLRYSDKMAKNILSGAIREGAKVIQKAAKAKIKNSLKPHKLKVKGEYIWIFPGNMKKNVRVKLDKSKTRQYVLTYEVYVKNATAYYWKWQEFGNSRHGPHQGVGFMRPAFEEAKVEAVEAVKDYIKARLELNK